MKRVMIWILWIMFCLPASAQIYVLDTDQVTTVGQWVRSSNTRPYGRDYLHDGAVAKGQRTAFFQPGVPPGKYRVEVYASVLDNRATSVPVIIEYDYGVATVLVSQRSGADWKSAGEYWNPRKITISNVGTVGYVIADAVRLTLVEEIPKPTPSPTPIPTPMPRPKLLDVDATESRRVRRWLDSIEVTTFSLQGRVLPAYWRGGVLYADFQRLLDDIDFGGDREVEFKTLRSGDRLRITVDYLPPLPTPTPEPQPTATPTEKIQGAWPQYQ